MTLDLSGFGLGEMLKCSIGVRKLGGLDTTMESAARRLSRYFYDGLRSSDGERSCALVRIYKVHPFAGLPGDLQRFARRALKFNGGDQEATPDMRTLALLATTGDDPAWNSRTDSKGHQAIPLPSPHIVQRAPMIAQLIRQFGLDLNDVVSPAENVVRKMQGKNYGVFHVEDAAGSPYIPAQAQFVQPFKIRSVLGFGGSVGASDLFAVILFSRTHVSPDAADRFRTIALDVKSVLLPYASGMIFDG